MIAGSILVGLYLLPALALIAWFVSGLLTASEAMSMVFVFWLIALLLLMPLWIVGIALLGVGRAQQRGPVTGSVAAWVLAIGAMPAIGVLLTLTVSAAGGGGDAVAGVAFAALVIGIPVLMVLSLASGAWLTWGKPRLR